ncbi:hypothetical protein [Lentibacillus jeotgali]|uniref:hypothetical protein n=1 Tax=Lentibacillus jeotgali TaxID=558169 RepID=UPI0002626FFB|nr:hypothetical protein [Lentibacillus jeotgali]
MSTKKKISQKDADVQVAIQDSDNAQVKIINSPIDYLEDLLHSGNLEEAAQFLGRIHRLSESAHPVNPHYIFKPVSIGKKTVFDHVPVNEQVSKDYPLKYKANFTIVDQKYSGETKTFDEILEKATINQDEIEINMKDIETWIGDMKIDDEGTLMREAVKSAKWKIMPQELPPPMKIKIVKEDDVDDITIIDYIELSLSDIDNESNVIVFDNSKQASSPHLVTVTINKGSFDKQKTKGKLMEADSKVNISIKEEHQGNVNAIYKLDIFVLNTLRSQNFRLVNLETGEAFVVLKNYNINKEASISKLEEELVFLKKLIKIEKYFNVNFSISEKIEADDHECVEILCSIIEDRSLKGTFDELNLECHSRESLDGLIRYEKQEKFWFMITQSVVIELFGQTITGIESRKEFNNVCLKDPEKAKRKYADMEDGETVKLKFVPGSNNQLTKTFKYVNDEG